MVYVILLCLYGNYDVFGEFSENRGNSPIAQKIKWNRRFNFNNIIDVFSAKIQVI